MGLINQLKIYIEHKADSFPIREKFYFSYIWAGTLAPPPSPPPPPTPALVFRWKYLLFLVLSLLAFKLELHKSGGRLLVSLKTNIYFGQKLANFPGGPQKLWSLVSLVANFADLATEQVVVNRNRFHSVAAMASSCFVPWFLITPIGISCASLGGLKLKLVPKS